MCLDTLNLAEEETMRVQTTMTMTIAMVATVGSVALMTSGCALESEPGTRVGTSADEPLPAAGTPQERAANGEDLKGSRPGRTDRTSEERAETPPTTTPGPVDLPVEPPKERPEDPKETPDPEDPPSGWSKVVLEFKHGLVTDLWVDPETDLVYATDTLGQVLQGAAGEDWVADWPSDAPLYGVAGRGDGAVTAVGGNGTIVSLVDGEWTAELSNTDETLAGVWFASSKNNYEGFAVGGSTILASFYPGEWWEMSAFVNWKKPTSYNAVGGTGDWEIFAVGDHGLIMKFNGKHWGQEESGTDAHLVGIAAQGAKTYVVGADGTLLLRNGDEWFVLQGALEDGIADIAPTQGHPVICGADGGFFTLGGKALSWSSIDTGSSEDFAAVAADSTGYWLGSAGGILRFD